ncbi:putative secreted protein [Patulibacter medicamentivorans]|uniref:Putative secreted protein n=1 Tax=Patulibacter medicamentivorans TaxID=1097667 RepID=H0EBW5_9ACTN|nr:putative secreted protein [Patulibacter medicamentivorans]
MTSGSFKLGTSTVPIGDTITLQGGYELDPDTGATTWINAEGGPTLSATPLDVPGGLLGLPDTTGWPGWLLDQFEAAVSSVNAVTATAELAGPVQFNLNNYFGESGTAITLPLRVKLSNPFLGNNCYIGSNSDPVLLQLTSGATSPPPPNTSISGQLGSVTVLYRGRLIKNDGFRLVDNAFRAPEADGCGNFFTNWLLDPAVNLKQGLPSSAGKNAAIMEGNQKIGNVLNVRASIPTS